MKADGARPGVSPARRVAIIVAALVLAGAALRQAAVVSLAERSPDVAARLWPGHPDVTRTLALRDLGREARAGLTEERQSSVNLRRLAIAQPYAIEPVLAAAVAAQSRNDWGTAERLYRIAEQRQARAIAPHYFLAEMSLRQGRLRDGLRQLVLLSRFAPGGSSALSPYVAAFARDPSHWPAVRAILGSDRDLAEGALTALAADPANSAAILALAPPQSLGPRAPWLPTLLAAQVADGDYAAARALWSRLSAIDPTAYGPVHDPTFRDTRSPPPFNWDLTRGAIGLAERRPGGGAHVIFYGNDNGVLMRQLIIAAPGHYRLASDIEGNPGAKDALGWKVACANDGRPLLDLPVRSGAGRAGVLVVPPACPALWLSLIGKVQDVRGDSDIVVHRAELTRLGTGQ